MYFSFVIDENTRFDNVEKKKRTIRNKKKKERIGAIDILAKEVNSVGLVVRC